MTSTFTLILVMTGITVMQSLLVQSKFAVRMRLSLMRTEHVAPTELQPPLQLRNANSSFARALTCAIAS
jgi:hypothetical protein